MIMTHIQNVINEISNAKYTCGIEFWDSLDDDLKIQCLLQLR